MFGVKLKKSWDATIAVLEDNIFSNDTRKWGEAVVSIEPDKPQTIAPHEEADLEFQDKRKEPRFSISLPVHHRLKGYGKNWKSTNSIDVSQNGIRITAGQPVQLGTRLELDIKLPNNQKKVRMEGVVVWQKPSFNNEMGWECGVAFESLRKLSKKEKLIEFMADRLCAMALKENHGMTCRPASTQEDLKKAYHLVYQEYLLRGYCKEIPSEMHYNYYCLAPGSQTFLLEKENKVIGTVSLIADSSLGLPTEGLFGDKINKLRKPGKQIGEVSLLALDHRHFGRKSFALTDLRKLAGSFLLFKILFDYGRKKRSLTDLFIAMHPRHKELYHYLQFNPIGPVRSYAGALGKPALPMHLDIERAARNVSEQLSIHHYFIEKQTPQEILNQSHPWTEESLEAFLLTHRPLWPSLPESAKTFFQSSFEGVLPSNLSL